MKLRRGFTDEDLITGSEETQRRARDELRRQQTLTAAKGSGLPQLEPGRLDRGRFGVITDRVSGIVYRVHRSDLPDPQHRGLAGYYIDGGLVTYLEELPAQRTRST